MSPQDKRNVEQLRKALLNGETLSEEKRIQFALLLSDMAANTERLVAEIKKFADIMTSLDVLEETP